MTDQQFHMPAEWEPHSATWLAWPHNPTDWPGKLGVMHIFYSHLVERLTVTEQVNIVVNSSTHEKKVRRHLERSAANMDQVRFFRFGTNRAWIRDFGPIFVEDAESGEQHIANFAFNGWARYHSHELDNQIPRKVGRALDIPVVPVLSGRPIVLEGGSIDHNGAGTLLTTEECLLDQATQARNPWLSRADIEAILARYIGAHTIIWLEAGLYGDDTHGHVDDCCRFVSEKTIVYCMEHDSRDINHRALKANEERLQSARLNDGSKPEIIPLPMPMPVYYDGHRLPASYANFYIANGQVLVPTFNDRRDVEALGILGELFPDRDVIGVYAQDLVWGLGAIHCITQQQPVA